MLKGVLMKSCDIDLKSIQIREAPQFLYLFLKTTNDIQCYKFNCSDRKNSLEMQTHECVYIFKFHPILQSITEKCNIAVSAAFFLILSRKSSLFIKCFTVFLRNSCLLDKIKSNTWTHTYLICSCIRT